MPDKRQHEPIRIPLKLLLLTGTPGAPAIDALQAMHARHGGVPLPCAPDLMVDVFAAATAVRALYKDPAAAEVELAHDLAEQVYNLALENPYGEGAPGNKSGASKSPAAERKGSITSDSGALAQLAGKIEYLTSRVEAVSAKLDSGGKRGDKAADDADKTSPCNCNHYERAFQLESLLGRVQALEEELEVIKIKGEYDPKERLLE